MVFGFKRMVRRLIRQNTSPIPFDRANYWKSKLSLVYMLVAWNALGLAVYYTFTGREDWAYYYGLKTEEEKKQRPGEYYAEILGLKNVRVITVEGFTKVGEYECKVEDAEKKQDKA